MILSNEFASVEVLLDDSTKVPRLMIRDLRTQKSIYLNPLELKNLAARQHQDFAMFVDPSYRTVAQQRTVNLE